MIIRIFDPRAGKRIPIEVAEPKATAPPSGHRPEYRQEGEHDHDKDQHEAENAAAAKMLPRETKAGEAMVEPPNVPMTGYNRESAATKLVIFYVSDPDTPFLDPVVH